MFKKLLSDNRIFGAIVCVLVFIVGGLLYLEFVQRQASRDTQEQQDTPQTAKAEAQTETGGHFHADGTWHAEPHAPATPKPAPPSAVTAQTQDAPRAPTREAAAGVSPDFSAAYQELREKYPEQTQNPPPFENVPVDLWDFEATKQAFMDHFNFYMTHYDPKEGGSHTRELRIASAVMAGIHNAAQPWVGLFTSEQREEIKEMRRSYRSFKGVKVNHDRVWELVHKEGYTVLEALRISREEGSN